jgi:hypothetical protein
LTDFFHYIFPWDSMENSMEFYESEVDIPWNFVNWNFMEFGFDRE